MNDAKWWNDFLDPQNQKVRVTNQLIEVIKVLTCEDYACFESHALLFTTMMPFINGSEEKFCDAFCLSSYHHEWSKQKVDAFSHEWLARYERQKTDTLSLAQGWPSRYERSDYEASAKNPLMVARTLMLNECAMRCARELYLTQEEFKKVLNACNSRAFLVEPCPNKWQDVLSARVHQFSFEEGIPLCRVEILKTDPVYETEIMTVLSRAKHRLEAQLGLILDPVLIPNLAAIVLLYAINGYT